MRARKEFLPDAAPSFATPIGKASCAWNASNDASLVFMVKIEPKDEPQRDTGESLKFPLCFSVTSVVQNFLQNISGQILILHNVSQHLPYIFRVNRDMLALLLRRIKAQLVEHALHDGV